MVVAAYRAKLDALAAHCSVELIVPERWGRLEFEPRKHEGFELHRVPALLHGQNHLHFYPSLGRVLRTLAPQLVHIDEEPYSTVTFQAARVCANARIPYVFFAWQNLPRPLPLPFRAMRAYVFQHASGAIAGTARAAEVLQQAGYTRSPAVIPQMGIDASTFTPDPNARVQTRQHLGIEPTAFLAGFAGRLSPEKGVDVLIDAVALAQTTNLLIIGDGPDRAALEARAGKLAGRVRFAGHISSTMMPSLLSALDVLILPSIRTVRWEEQFGRVLVEAMACGVPVIGTRTGEIARVIGKAGIVVPERDPAALAAAIASLANDPHECARLGKFARERALANFTNARIASDTADFYHTVTV
jgi:glycosyltransferase involved in cell wall biosynthesis